MERFAFGARPRIEDLCPSHARRERHARGEPLSDAQEVRHDGLVIAGEYRTGPAEARVDLVGDEEPACFVADRAESAQESVARDPLAAATLHWLDDDGPDLVRSFVRYACDRVEIVVGNEAGAIRESRGEGLAEVLPPGRVEGTERETVIGAFEGE